MSETKKERGKREIVNLKRQRKKNQRKREKKKRKRRKKHKDVEQNVGIY